MREFVPKGSLYLNPFVRYKRVCMISPIVWCSLSTISFGCGFLKLIGLQGILQSFDIMVLNSAKRYLPLSTVILLGRGYLFNQASSTSLATRSTLAQNVFLSIPQLDLPQLLLVHRHTCLSCLLYHNFLSHLLLFHILGDIMFSMMIARSNYLAIH